MTRFAWLVVVAACHSSPASIEPDATGPEPSVRYPDPDWETGKPEDHGLDGAKLDEAAAAAAANDSYCLLVIRHGVLVSETYFAGTTRETTPRSWSIAKSYTSTVTGIAIDRGALPGLDTNVASLVPEWNNTPKATITIRDLLRMTSGLEWSVFSDYIRMATFANDHSAYATDLDAAAAPGSEWKYHNGGVQMIEPVFRAATNQTIETYARDHLWSKIGMTATWEHDDAGHPTTYANVLATCRDHARLGYLYLRGGKWKSEQIVSPAYVASALAPSQQFNRGYGYLFWLNGEAPTMTPMQKHKETKLYPYAPADLFAARGFGSQFIDVIPSLDMVIVRFGKDPTAMMSFDPEVVQNVLIQDESSDTHRAIVEPILGAVR